MCIRDRGRITSVSHTVGTPWSTARSRSSPAPVSMLGAGRGAISPSDRSSSCMKTRFQISMNRSSLTAGPPPGPAAGPGGGPAVSEDRFIEIWNLVFMQLDERSDGEMAPLPAPSIDTGAGLDRLLAVLQGVPTVWDTDVMRPLSLIHISEPTRPY